MTRFLAVHLGLLALLSIGSRVADASDLAVVDALSQPSGVQLEKLRLANGVVRGELVNSTAAEVSDVHLLIRYVWLWKNERNPGDDNPGRSEYDVVEGPIAPGARASFEHTPSPPLPVKRSDGRFQVEAVVVGLTQVEH